MFAVKKYGAFCLAGFLPAMALLISAIMFDLFMAIMICMAFLALGVVLAAKMIDHPMLGLLEGKGMLTMTWDSTGIIETFLVQADAPFVRGKFKNKTKETMFDREIVNYILPPKQGKMVEATTIDNQGNVTGKKKVLIMPDQEEKPDYLFSFGSYPCFIFNKSLDNFLQKSLLSNFESNTFVKHMVLHLLKKTEDLSIHVRDFARYIVEATRPKKNWFAQNSWVVWMIIIGVIIVLGILFVPALLESFGGAELPSLPTGGTLTP